MATQTVPAAGRQVVKEDNQTAHYKSYLTEAGRLLSGDLVQTTKDRKDATEVRNKTLWQVLLNLLVYAQNVVFAEGYSKPKVTKFLKDLEETAGISNRSAQKYVEAVNTGLGVRGNRAGMRKIEGLPAACENKKTLEQFLIGKEITSFNKFRDAIRVGKSPVKVAAEYLAKLSTEAQRQKAMELAEKLVKDKDAEEDEDC